MYKIKRFQNKLDMRIIYSKLVIFFNYRLSIREPHIIWLRTFSRFKGLYLFYETKK